MTEQVRKSIPDDIASPAATLPIIWEDRNSGRVENSLATQEIQSGNPRSEIRGRPNLEL